MTGTITILVQNEAGQMVAPPSNYEFGLSINRFVAPVQSQASNVFTGLYEGIYYIFYRQINTNWDVNHVLKENVIIPVSSNYIRYVNDGNSVLLKTAEGNEICTKLLRQSIDVVSYGQHEFVIPNVVNKAGITGLWINAEKYFEGTGYTLNNSKISWHNLFQIDTDDEVAVEYIVQQLTT